MPRTTEIEQAEDRLREAMLAGDVEMLDKLLSAQAVFTDQAGVRLSKADDIAAHRSGLLRIDRLEPTDRPLIRPLGDCAIVCVTVELSGSYDGQPFGGAFAYSRLWHRHEDGLWRVEMAHCSPAGQS